MCISNRIGAGLMSNAVWQGVRLRDLLEASRPLPGAVEVFLNGADAYTDTFAFEKAMDPTTIVAFAMNGEPLPQRHGYPARVVVPGLYGEKNVKWVTRIEVVDYDAKGFYEQQGWGPNFVIPTRSDIFGPRWVRRRGDASSSRSPPARWRRSAAGPSPATAASRASSSAPTTARPGAKRASTTPARN